MCPSIHCSHQSIQKFLKSFHSIHPLIPAIVPPLRSALNADINCPQEGESFFKSWCCLFYQEIPPTPQPYWNQRTLYLATFLSDLRLKSDQIHWYCSLKWAYCTSPWWHISMQQLWNKWQGESPMHCHFVFLLCRTVNSQRNPHVGSSPTISNPRQKTRHFRNCRYLQTISIILTLRTWHAVVIQKYSTIWVGGGKRAGPHIQGIRKRKDLPKRTLNLMYSIHQARATKSHQIKHLSHIN